MKSAIVTGFCGQDGSYLTELLLKKGYKVYGIKRRNSDSSLSCASHLEKEPNLEIIEADLLDLPSLLSICKRAKANEFYNLAAQSHVGTSFDQPFYTAQVNALGTLNCLEAIRHSGIHTKFYQASTSELFGGMQSKAYSESDLFHPRSPYGVAKLYAYWITVNYRESYNMFACNGILFNHESPRRGPNFVTRKISLAVANIKKGKQRVLKLGNLAAKRDWGHARDFVEGMWLMLQQPEPEDYVLATGETHSVEEFCEAAFEHAGLGDFRKYVEIDMRYYRPAEVDVLIGDASKAKEKLGWEPKTTFADLAKEMVDHDSGKFQ